MIFNNYVFSIHMIHSQSFFENESWFNGINKRPRREDKASRQKPTWEGLKKGGIAWIKK